MMEYLTWETVWMALPMVPETMLLILYVGFVIGVLIRSSHAKV